MPRAKKAPTNPPDLTTTPKVVFIDYGVFLFRSIFIWRQRREIPASYTSMSMMFGCLNDVGLNEDDLVIIAIDGRGSWRKDVDSSYKANRKEFRESFTDIDWEEKFAESDKLIENLTVATPFYPIKIDRLEADDIIAVGVRYYQDRPCVVISSDQDYEQLCAFPNVRVFSDRKKAFKDIKNPYEVLAKKIRKEAADNLHEEITNQGDYERREQIVSLLRLPDFVEAEVTKALGTITGAKTFDWNLLRYNHLKDYWQKFFRPVPKLPQRTRRKSTKPTRRKKKAHNNLGKGE